MEYKQKKFEKKYIKNKKMVKDSEGRKREIGELALDKLPKETIMELFTMIWPSQRYLEADLDEEEKGGIEEFNKDDGTVSTLTEQMKLYSEVLKARGMSYVDVFKLMEEYYKTFYEDEEKAKTFCKLFASTCTVKYRDYDGNTSSDWDEHPHFYQSDIDHEAVGEYKMVMTVPVPMDVLDAMKNGIVKSRLASTRAKEDELNKKFNLGSLNELAKKL